MSEEKRTWLDITPLSHLSSEAQIRTAERLGSAQFEKKDPRTSLMGAFTPGSRYENLPIIRTPFDQPIPEGISNPYWDIVRRIPGRPYLFNPVIKPDGYWSWTLSVDTMKAAEKAGITRFHLCARYSWAIPTTGDIRWLKEKLMGQDVVEIGAGSGYWAWQMSQMGIGIDAFDPHPPGEDNPFNTHQLYHPVGQSDHQIAADYPDRALMISWPLHQSDFATEALKIYEGDTVIYIGENEGGCCGDGSLFETLNAEWDLEDNCGAHVTWWGLHDRLEIYRRR